MKKIAKVLALILSLTLMLSLAACGGKDSGTQAPETQAPAETTQAAEEETGGEAQWDAAAALDALLAANPKESNYLVLSGIAGGWAPTVLVLDNDGNFIALVDYAGQATVNFATGTYEEKEDGSITCEGIQYNTGEDLIYEIAFADGTYTATVDVPDTGASADLTGTK